MFGRSGQMFPRRTFHDAIYEEEYGSDNEDECCRCRGLSAILCWFLSVIILVGLAATVVLTVFFILRSRSLIVKPDADLDVEMYGKDQNLFESQGSKELSSNEAPNLGVSDDIGVGSGKRRKSKRPDVNDVDGDVNEEQNTINDSSEAEDSSVNHSRNHNHHTHNGRHNRLQPYQPKTTTTEAPEPSEENHESSSEEEEVEQSNAEGSSLFNLFSGPRNPSYNTPSENEDGGLVTSAESSEYKSTRQNDSPVQQVLFTESPKVTVTTPNPYNSNRRNLQTTRFPTGRTSFSTTTTEMPPPQESEEEEENDDHEHEEESNEDENDEKVEKSSEEKVASSVPTTTSVYGQSNESEMGSESGESQLKQMLLDSIPPHGGKEKEEADFNLGQIKPYTTTQKARTTKQPKTRQDTLTRIIARNYTRDEELSTVAPSVTTMGPAGHKYDYTMTPIERTKLKIKSGESMEQDVKPREKSRYKSTTSRPAPSSSRAPNTQVPRTRGTTLASESAEYGIKLGGKRGSVESPIDIVPSPDLSRKDPSIQQNSLEGTDLSASDEDQVKTSSEQQFLDVLVGSEDQKTLVTKNTQEGIVTSAILPPWYDSNGSNSSITDVLATNGTSLSNTVAKVEDEVVIEASNFGEKTTKRKSNDGSEFERLVNLFSKQEESEEEAPVQNRFGFKKQKPVLKKTGPGRFVPQPVPGRTGFPGRKQEAKEPEDASPAPTLSEPSGDVGRTGVLPTAADVEAVVENSGYYPENDKEKVVEQHVVESERLSSDEASDEQQPSHVIDVNFEEAADSPAEIIIEQDSSLPAEDEEAEFTEGDYEEYQDNARLSMAGSEANQNYIPAPNGYVRGSGIRKPVSSEENLDTQASASTINPSTIAPSTLAPQISTSAAPAVVRRPAYTREEIAKAVVKPSPEPPTNNQLNDGSNEAPTSDEFEEYEDDNYEGGSVEQNGSVEHWSKEKNTKWSAPDKIRDEETAPVGQQYASEEILKPSDSVPQATVQTRLNGMNFRRENATFSPPQPQNFHENKVSFSPPIGEANYHSKDGWRPVITEAPVRKSSQEFYDSSREGHNSFEPEREEPQETQQLYQEPLPQQTQQIQPVQVRQQQMKPAIPPPVSATVKFPDSEEAHEDRHHRGRPRQPMQHFDRSKYMVRPVPPPIVMRRHPHSTGPFPPQPLRNGPPPPPPQQIQRQQIMAQASEQNPQFLPPPPPQQQQPRPPISPMNRNFHIRPNPLRRFNFGGPAQAQPRSGGNIKWPTDDNEGGKRLHIETVQAEVSSNRRRRAVGV